MKTCSGAWINGTAMTLDLVYSACASRHRAARWSLAIERLIPPHPRRRETADNRAWAGDFFLLTQGFWDSTYSAIAYVPCTAATCRPSPPPTPLGTDARA